MFCEIEKECSLFDVIGYQQKAVCLKINGIAIGDSNAESRMEMSNDRTFLKVYTIDDFVSTAKIPVKNIEHISFGVLDKDGNYTGESISLRSEFL